MALSGKLNKAVANIETIIKETGHPDCLSRFIIGEIEGMRSWAVSAEYLETKNDQLRAYLAKKDEEIARLRGWVRYFLSSNAAPPEGSNLREIIDEINPIDVRDVYRAALSQDPEPVEGEGKQ